MGRRPDDDGSIPRERARRRARELEAERALQGGGRPGGDEGVVSKGRQAFKETLREAANYRELRKTPYGLLPIGILTIVGAVAAFDVRIFGLAIEQIVRDLDIEILTLVTALNVVSLFLALGVVGAGYLADRVRRVPILGIGAIIMGLASLLTSRANSITTLGLGRGFDGLGDRASDVPIASLIGDYYPPHSRGKVFALRGVIARLLGVAAPVIVGLALLRVSWRVPYMVTGPILIVAGIMAIVVLKDPIRGYMERRSMGLSEEESRRPEDPPSFGEGWRTVWSIRTLRRLFISDIPFFGGDFALGIFLPLWAFERYGLNEFQLGLVFAAASLVALPFGFMSGGLVDVLIRRRPQRVLVLTGLLNMAAAVAIFLVGTGPALAFFVFVFVAWLSASALIGPARSVLYVQIAPAHVRTLALNIRALAEIPAALFRGLIIFYFVDLYGTQGGIYAAGAFWLIGSMIELSAAGLFPGDMRSAMASQAASAEWRRAQAEGRGKMLVCREVDVDYDGVQVLFGIDFEVEEGEMIALLGTNGAGKSTLLKAISGVHEASGGAVVLDGREITHMPPHEIAARGVSFMPGGRGVFPDLTVEENLRLGNWLHDGGGPRNRIETVYRIFPALQQRRGERAQLLSGGEQQMLSLGQAFLARPKLLMIDELSLGLAPQVVSQLVEIVKRINEGGTTVIIVEQSVNVALTVAEKAIFMEKGEVKFSGETEELLRRPDILRAVYVKGSGSLTESGRASGVKGERERRLQAIEGARPVIEAHELRKAFGGVVAVDDVSFDLREGEALGLIGPNGAGKTTAFDLVSGYQEPDSGRIVFDGVDVTERSAQERARLGLVRRFQDARLFPSLTVYENILVALERQVEVRSMTLTALQVPQARQAERRARRRAERLIELLELGAYRDKFVKELSTGLRRISDIACVLATEPKVLLLDEPSTGIAQAESESLAPLLRRVRHETGCSMLIIEHDMSLIAAISDELLAMDQGRVVVRGTPDDVLDDDRVIESYLGTSEEVIQRSDAGGEARTRKKKRSKAGKRSRSRK